MSNVAGDTEILDNITRSFLNFGYWDFACIFHYRVTFLKAGFPWYRKYIPRFSLVYISSVDNHSALNTIKTSCWIANNYIFPKVTFLLLDFWTFLCWIISKDKYLFTVHSSSVLSGCFGQFRNVDNWKQFLNKDKAEYWIISLSKE